MLPKLGRRAVIVSEDESKEVIHNCKDKVNVILQRAGEAISRWRHQGITDLSRSRDITTNYFPNSTMIRAAVEDMIFRVDEKEREKREKERYYTATLTGLEIHGEKL